MRARGGGPSQSAPCAWACSFVQGLANARCGAAATLAAAGVLVLVTTLAAVHVPSWSVAARITPTAKAHLANRCAAGPWPWHPPRDRSQAASTPHPSNATVHVERPRSLGVGPVFVVGCGHSGTSLMTRMLGAHSRLWNYPGETGMLEKGSLARARAIGTDLQRQATQAGAVLTRAHSTSWVRDSSCVATRTRVRAQASPGGSRKRRITCTASRTRLTASPMHMWLLWCGTGVMSWPACSNEAPTRPRQRAIVGVAASLRPCPGGTTHV